jgi:hypothetical protein
MNTIPQNVDQRTEASGHAKVSSVAELVAFQAVIWPFATLTLQDWILLKGLWAIPDPQTLGDPTISGKMDYRGNEGSGFIKFNPTVPPPQKTASAP